MRLNYKGLRDNNKINSYCKGKRFAEITYNDGEELYFAYIIKHLKSKGWKVDDGVEYWACIEVEDKDEFESLKEYWMYLKRCYKFLKYCKASINVD